MRRLGENANARRRTCSPSTTILEPATSLLPVVDVAGAAAVDEEKAAFAVRAAADAEVDSVAVAKAVVNSEAAVAVAAEGLLRTSQVLRISLASANEVRPRNFEVCIAAPGDCR